jgi:hypothetical protein
MTINQEAGNWESPVIGVSLPKAFLVGLTVEGTACYGSGRKWMRFLFPQAEIKQ